MVQNSTGGTSRTATRAARKTVFVGMSGGVDSSVTAALLLEQGYAVTGVYMKNWSQDLPGMHCPWQEDYQDAKRVAVQLGIPFKLYDFERQYRAKVVDYMLAGYRAGRTPNPDIMCNQEVKFKLFLQAAIADGAELVATGHYARVDHNADSHSVWPSGRVRLLTGRDANKDQSYFLYRVTSQALARTLMPVGEYEKPQIRAIATRLGLATAAKKDSQGICFVGKVGIRDFLLHELGQQRPGPIVDQHGRRIGEHDGALLYTIGQRQGLHVGGGLPYYVTGKDMASNTVYVTTDLQDGKLWRRELELADMHWINGRPASADGLMVRTRYRAGLVPLTNLERTADTAMAGYRLTLAEEVRAITPGQSAVIYRDEQVLGGGIVR